MFTCPIHGPAMTCIYSPALLEFQEDGTLPEVVIVEIKDSPEEEAFFRVNITQKEAKELPISNGCIPFDMDAADLTYRLPQMCCFCLRDQRKALEVEQKRGK